MLHDLDMFVMSVDTRRYYRSNHHDTIATMCGTDESCAEKYEFTFENSLADYMNPVERVAVPSTDLEEGYHVVGVRARTLTESDDVQAYGLAAAGGDLVLHGMSKNWTDLLLETDSTHGSGVGAEPDPDGELNGATPAPSVLVAEGSADGGAPTGNSAIVAPTSAPVETATGSTFGSGTSMDGDEGDGSSTGSGAGVSHLGGGDDDISAAGGIETDVPDSGDLDGDGGGGSGVAASGTTITTIVASSAAAALLIGAGICLALRRNKLRSASGRHDYTGSFLCPVRHGSSSAGGTVVSGGGSSGGHDEETDHRGHHDDDGEEDDDRVVGFYEGGDMPPLEPRGLPGYATAVASMPEEEGHTIIRDRAGVERMVELTAGDESEVSGFYYAVDPGAVETLVSWGISRDFARVALRQTDNDVQAALKMIAEGNMDELLAMDHEEMAREGREAAAAEAAAAGRHGAMV